MKKENIFKKSWKYLKKDTWDAWLVSIVLVFIIIRFIFFPFLSFATGTSLPLVVIESCSMYHESDFDDWWFKNSAWYEKEGISKEQFEQFSFKNGLNKGDIILVTGSDKYEMGEIIIFEANSRFPLIHRIVTDPENYISTKGDNNLGQLNNEKFIEEDEVIGKAAVRIPLIGWIKLIFFEPFKPENQRGLCK